MGKEAKKAMVAELVKVVNALTDVPELPENFMLELKIVKGTLKANLYGLAEVALDSKELE